MKVDLSAFDNTTRGYALLGVEALCIAFGGGNPSDNEDEWQLFNTIRKELYSHGDYEYDRRMARNAAAFIVKSRLK